MKIVEIETASANDPRASCDPPLNPNQPNQSTKTPIVTKGIDDAAKGLIGVGTPAFVNLPYRGPSIIIPASAAAPPVE